MIIKKSIELANRNNLVMVNFEFDSYRLQEKPINNQFHLDFLH